MSKKSNSAAILAALLAGATTGVVLGLLYAPEEGKETRKKSEIKQTILKIKLLMNTAKHLKK
jgi:gas vesicle protein